MQANPNAPNRADALAGLALFVLFATFLGRSWLAWGHLVSDHGREMFVPLRLAAGDVLYQDIRYPYGPFSPYLHALFYRLGEPHLAVLYASGIASTALVLTSAYVIGRKISSVAAAAVGTALILVDLAFRPAVPGFSLIFPYAFPGLHGLLFVLVALAASLRSLETSSPGPPLLTGLAIGLTLLTKQEFALLGLGIGALTGTALVAVHGWQRARSRIALLVAGSLGVPLLGYGVLCIFVDPSTILWRGLFAPEYFGWPITWHIAGLQPGMTPGGIAAHLASLYTKALPYFLVAAALVVSSGYAFARDSRGETASSGRKLLRLTALGIALACLAMLLYQTGSITPSLDPARLRYAYFPALLGIWLLTETFLLARAWRRSGTLDPAAVQRWVVLAVGLAMLARVPGKAIPGDYANFYLAPGLLLAAALLVDILPRALRKWGAHERAARASALLLLLWLTASLAVVRWDDWGRRDQALVTARGTMMLDPNDVIAPMYREGLAAIEASTDPDETILAVPTEISLYFLSGRTNALYETSFVAVLTTEDAEDGYIAELEADPPVLVLVSNRLLVEYGRGYFGRDYGRKVYDWLREHYVPDEVTLGGPIFSISAWRPRTKETSGGTAAVSREQSLVYQQVDGEELTLDIIRPAGFAGLRPTLVFFHGGGWRDGDKSDAFPDTGSPWAHQGDRSWPTMAPYLELGLAVVSVEYRRTAQARAPAAIVDTLAALDWIAANGRAYGLDPQRVVVVGPSAGGHLALMAALTYDRGVFPSGTEPPPARATILGAIDLYGPTDLADLIEGENQRSWAKEWIGGEPGQAARARQASPLEHLHADAPPILIIHGDEDRVVPYEQSTRLRDAIESAGGTVELKTLPGGSHGFLDPQEQFRLEAFITAFLTRLGLIEVDTQPGGEPDRDSQSPAGAGSGK